MCNFVQTHRDVIEKEHNLRKYHLGLHEWDMVEQLSRVLKASNLDNILKLFFKNLLFRF